MQCYKLVNNARDKMLAYTKGLAVGVFGVAVSLPLLIAPHDPVVQDFWPVWLTVCILIILGCAPLILIDALTSRICITDQGISVASAVKRLGEPWISWDQLVSVDVQSNPVHVSGIKRVMVRGRHEVHGLGGAYRITRVIVIPGHLADIQRILASLRESARQAHRAD